MERNPALKPTSRVAGEKATVAFMIGLYCRKKEKNAALCPGCQALLTYAHARLDHCRFGEEKPSCQHCPLHCYKPEMKEKMKQVMRFSGPRMLWYAPARALPHLFRK